jgi:hypothetical protein
MRISKVISIPIGNVGMIILLLLVHMLNWLLILRYI